MGNFPPLDDDVSTVIQSQPYSREAEEAVLGSVLINPDSYFEISEVINPDDFYIIRNQWIWNSYIRLHERRVPIDILTVSEDLQEQGQLGEIGGQAYLLALVNQTPTSLHGSAYAQIVEQTSIRRRMLASANELAKLAYDQGKEVKTILDAAEKSVFGLSARRVRHDLESIGTVVSDYYDHVDELSKRDEEISGVPTGLTDLDIQLGGMQKSDLLIIAGGRVPARPGSCSRWRRTPRKNTRRTSPCSRSKCRTSSWCSASSRRRPVSIPTVYAPADCSTRSGTCSPRPLMYSLPLTSGWTTRRPSRRWRCAPSAAACTWSMGLDLILVDYLQLMGSDSRSENRVQEVSYISRSLKVLARELNVPVMAAAQLSRAVEQREGKRPVLSDLRESGSLEQDSDIVMFIHRPDKDDKDMARRNIAELIVAKHRNGPTHSGIELVFLEKLAKFENAAPAEDAGAKKKR